jgi:hypothetical protein
MKRTGKRKRAGKVIGDRLWVRVSHWEWEASRIEEEVWRIQLKHGPQNRLGSQGDQSGLLGRVTFYIFQSIEPCGVFLPASWHHLKTFESSPCYRGG